MHTHTHTPGHTPIHCDTHTHCDALARDSDTVYLVSIPLYEQQLSARERTHAHVQRELQGVYATLTVRNGARARARVCVRLRLRVSQGLHLCVCAGLVCASPCDSDRGAHVRVVCLYV